ncbi:Dabb family protein [Sphingomonas sp.]|uniref:Dabb family protein n=1 Tax=Sphingomonas sp. TaxID=28214 RepID=UPI002ED7812E
MASDAASAAPAPEARIVHHVFFWLKRPGSTADRDQLVAGLRALAKIPVIRSVQIGVPASTEQREVVDASFDVSELMVFDNVADQKVYQDHPIHQDFIAKCGHLWRKVIVYDMLTI